MTDPTRAAAFLDRTNNQVTSWREWLRERGATDGMIEQFRISLDRAFQQARAAGRAAGLREAEYTARHFGKLQDMEWWQQTKKDITSAMCREVADAIKQQASTGGEQ